jgi:hypothetical protein
MKIANKHLTDLRMQIVEASLLDDGVAVDAEVILLEQLLVDVRRQVGVDLVLLYT